MAQPTNSNFFTYDVVPEQTEKQSESDQVFKGYQLNPESSIKCRNYAYEALYHIQEVSTFSLLFFSEENISEIQKLIKYNIYIASGNKFKIGNQDSQELKSIMRSVYLQFSRVPESRSEYTEAIATLNKKVVETIIPKLLGNIKQYLKYRIDSESPINPIDRSQNMSQTGTKSNRSVTDVFFGVSPAVYNQQFYN